LSFIVSITSGFIPNSISLILCSAGIAFCHINSDILLLSYKCMDIARNTLRKSNIQDRFWFFLLCFRFDHIIALFRRYAQITHNVKSTIKRLQNNITSMKISVYQKRKNRKRDIGAGRPFKLDVKERFLMLLVYYRLYIT